MENNTALENKTAAYQKASLIHEARELLVAADLIDERDDLDEASFTDWYDRTIPEVRDIEILAGAMKIELARRRGERIEREGERRGGDQKSGIKVTDSVTLISGAARVQRSRDRLLHTQAAAVTTYVQGEAKAGRVPSIVGATSAANLAQAKPIPKYKVKHFESVQKRVERSDIDIIASLDRIADGIRRSDVEIIKIIRVSIDYFLRCVRLIPWLRINRTIEGTVFLIDGDLRAICEGNRPRPELELKSISGYLRDLRAEIKQRRKNNHDEFMKRRWDSLPISKREQTELLDWIEQQLDRIPTL